MSKKIQVVSSWEHFEALSRHFSSQSRFFFKENGKIKAVLSSETSWGFKTDRNKRKIREKLKKLGFVKTRKEDFVEF